MFSNKSTPLPIAWLIAVVSTPTKATLEAAMKLDNIKMLISRGESETLEFKKSTTQLKAGMETLCAFLNTRGGVLLTGVKNNGDILGQDITDQTKLEISNAISKFEPPADILIKYIDVPNDKKVIHILTKPNIRSIPYTFDGKAFWRIESATRSMPQQKYKQLLAESIHKSDPWECSLADKITIDDLDASEIIATIVDCIKRGRMEPRLSTTEPEEALRRLRLIDHSKLTNAAVVLFSKDPEQFYPECLMRLIRFKGTTKDIIIDNKRIHGNAFKLLGEAEDFVMRHMSIASEFVPGKMARKDIPDYPLRAVREAVVNGISHRDYTIPGGSISLMMYDNRLEITSHGVLPPGITIQDLKRDHESQPRNERITQVLYKRGIIESAGSGTQLIIKECAEISKPEPEFVERGNTFVVIFRNEPSQEAAAQTKIIDNLHPRLIEILDVMRSTNSCTSSQILDKLESAPTDRTLRNDLNKLEELGLVLRTGGGSATRWRMVRKP